MEGPMLARTDPSQRFYINTDFSKDRMGEVLLQSFESVEARK